MGGSLSFMRTTFIISLPVFFLLLLVSCSPSTEELYAKAEKLQEQKKYKKAIDLLESTYDERGNWLVWVKYDPALDPIRKEKRFIILLNKMKYN